MSTKPWQKRFRVPRAEKPEPIAEPLSPPEWRKMILQVVAPDEDRGDPGTVVEARYARVGHEVHVVYDDKLFRAPLNNPDDDLRVAAGNLLRIKWRGGRTAFSDPIDYGPQRWIV
jgi:hypothetical protein